jgi:hypothetical protein
MEYFVLYFDGFGKFHQSYRLIDGVLKTEFDLTSAKKYAAEEVKKGACKAEVCARKEGSTQSEGVVARCHRTKDGGTNWEKLNAKEPKS